MHYVPDRRRAFALVLAAILATATSPAISQPPNAVRQEPVPVEVTNGSQPVLCAEKDNVSIAFTSPRVRSFRIEAAHPVYMSNLQRDSFEPDWTDCDMSGDPVFAAPVPPRRVTIYEEIDFWLVGLTFPTFWRPATATVRVGDRVEHGIHLLQLWMIRPMGGEEVLVVYPQDGYWRIRPKTPSGLDTTVFGSSFLIGPVEDEGRPVVRLEELAFDPETKTFTLTFERGGSATVQIVETDQNRHALHVVFDKPIEGRPFAAMRSMYVTEFNNDAARIALREPGAKGWREEPIMSFDRAMATDIWLGRLTPSRHNTSSPDMIFNSFSETTKPRLRRNEPPPEVEPRK
jgi:hypothetical protein